MKYITPKGLKKIRDAVEAKDRGTVELPVILMLALLNDFDEKMNIKVEYFPSVQVWIATEGDQHGVGCTYYEAIGRLMSVLSQVREDITIELEE